MYSTGNIPDRLVKSFFEDGVVAFVGAGLSANEGLPNWHELIESMFSEIKNDISDLEQQSIAEHISSKNYLLVADYLKDKFNEVRYKDFIERKFNTNRSGKIQNLLTTIPFKGIITTNYDDILSRSDHQGAFSYPLTYDDPEVFRKTKKRFILHAHGISTSPGNTILSSTDYDNLNYSSKNITFWEAMKSIFQRHKVLFIGYSLNDPDINLFLTKLKYIFPGNLNEHHALIYNNNNDLLNIFRMTKFFGIDPIFLSTNEPIGESMYNWLSELKVKVMAESQEHIQEDNIDSSNLYKNPRISELLIQLSRSVKRYEFESFVSYVNSILADRIKPKEYTNFEDLWSRFILNLSPNDLKKLLSGLIIELPNDANLKKLLLFLP